VLRSPHKSCTDSRYDVCFSESWLRSGDSNNPKGAIAMYGSSINQPWIEPCVAQAEAVDLLVEDFKLTIGGLCFNGSCKMIEDYPSSGPGVFDTWHIFGDAATSLWTDTPSGFSNVQITDNGSSITVNTGISGSDICLSSSNNGEDYLELASNTSSHTFTGITSSDRPLYVTVTKHNYIPYSAITGGTLGGIGQSVFLFGDVTIVNNSTLTILPGTHVKFEGSSADLKIQSGSKIIAEGTSSNKIYFEGASGGNWGNVLAYGNNNSFKYCVFDGGKYNLYLSNSSGNDISYCEFKNGQQIGLRLYNSDADIKYSYVHHNDGNGVSMGYSSALMLDNTISYNSTSGINCTGYCEPDLVLYYQDGYNIIKNNSFDGVLISYYSDAMLGISTWQHFGKNSVYGNSNYDLKSYSYSDAYAIHNWWGVYPPLSSQFYCDATSTLNRNYPLSSVPGGGSPLDKVSANSPDFDVSEVDENNPEELYQLARYYRYVERDNSAALKTNEEIVEKFPKSLYARKALVQIFHIHEQNNLPGLKSYLESQKEKSLISETSGTINDLSILKHLRDEEYKEAESLCREVIEVMPGTYSEIIALCNLVILYNNQLADADLANEYLNAMKKKYPNDHFTLFAREEMGEKVDWSEAEPYKLAKEGFAELSAKAIPEDFALGSNYPNPFNPSTTIDFSLPKNSKVDLTIYNALGQVVRNDAFNLISAGVHQFVWDGKNDNGGYMSSGLYILHFNAYSLEGDGESFTKSIKLLLVR
jgi:hypothetical protein